MSNFSYLHHVRQEELILIAETAVDDKTRHSL